jgi:hypothetical protein
MKELSFEPLRARVGHAATQRVIANYSIEQVSERYEALFAESPRRTARISIIMRLCLRVTRNSFITDATTFHDDPAALSAAREKLGTALHRRSLAR